jgi:hypothetical protein
MINLEAKQIFVIGGSGIPLFSQFFLEFPPGQPSLQVAQRAADRARQLTLQMAEVCPEENSPIANSPFFHKAVRRIWPAKRERLVISRTSCSERGAFFYVTQDHPPGMIVTHAFEHEVAERLSQRLKGETHTIRGGTLKTQSSDRWLVNFRIDGDLGENDFYIALSSAAQRFSQAVLAPFGATLNITPDVEIDPGAFSGKLLPEHY